MVNLYRAIVAVVFLFGCSRIKEPENSSGNMDSIRVEAADSIAIDYGALESYVHSGPVDTTAVETIDFDCAVLVYPTEEQIEAMKKEYGEDDFYTVADDSQFYQGMAIEKIDSAGIKTLGAEKQFLRFKGKDHEWTVDIRKKDLRPWNIFFFKVDKVPKVVSAIEVTSADSVKAYFNH